MSNDYRYLNKLTDYLNNTNENDVKLSIEDIEKIIGESLPIRAKKESNWWDTSSKNPHAHFWIDAGYRTIDCKKTLLKGTIYFSKDNTSNTNDFSNGALKNLICFTDNQISFISAVLGIIGFLIPNIPTWERFLFVIIFFVFNFAYRSPVFNDKWKKAQRIVVIVCPILFGLLFVHSIINDVKPFHNNDHTLSMSLLPLNTKPLPVKVSGKDDTVELYCSDMLPELDFQLLNGGDTAVTATSIDVEIYDYEEFSKKEIAEHTWLNKEPSEILFEAGNVISSEAENEERYIYNNAKLDYINIKGKLYHDIVQNIEVDNGSEDARFTIDRYVYLRFTPEIEESGHYIIQLLIHYTDANGQSTCKSEEIDFYYLKEQINELLEEDPNSKQYFLRLGFAYYYRCDYTKALEYFEKAREIQEEVLGVNDNIHTAYIYIMLSEIYYIQRDYNRALEYLEKVCLIRENVLGIDHPSTARTYSEIAHLYYAQNNDEKAMEYFGKALAIQEKMPGEDHTDAAWSYGGIANVYEAQGNNKMALEYYEKARVIQEKALGEDHVDTARTYNHLGFLYRERGEYKKAQQYYEKARVIREKNLGISHPYTALTYNGIANLYSDQGEYEKAEEYYEKALTVQEKVLGVNHPDVAGTYYNKGIMYEKQGNYEMSLECYEKARVIQERVLGTDNLSTAKTYYGIAQSYAAQHDYENAQEFDEKALLIQKKELGDDHVETARTYCDLAIVYTFQGDYENAHEYFEKARITQETLLGEDHFETVRTYYGLGILYYVTGKYQESNKCLQKAYSIYSNNYGNDTPLLKAIEDLLDKVNQKLDQ